ncbi:acyltransferase 3 [Desulfovibrio sp. X2]|uniref:acyltransferase family protein n=1 Tax=Desulfovibrio sp. X2 TaxID=941449 RepID=UPI000358AE89|nr:acyltransferase family protein [Desulfovibrio sp. X2]EPR41221.1 acyltransferase 3 [Desulfovibrio sp. X2]
MNQSALFSRNAQILKLLSILTIAFGHFYLSSGLHYKVMDYWWCLSAIGLIVFACTSGYFTALRYGPGFDIGRFWRRKLVRLGYAYTTLNVFLAALFLAEGRHDVFSFHSFLSWIGMKGFLTWFGIHNQSPFGAGLWFLTLLLLFYLAYPLLERVNRNPVPSWLFTASATALCLWLVDAVPMTHTLWITLAGFLLGVFLAKREIALSRGVCLGGLALLGGGMLALNLVLHVTAANSALLLVLGVLAVEACRHVRLPEAVASLLLPVSSYILEIYILHAYLFVHPLPPRNFPLLALDFLSSLTLILSLAMLLSKLAQAVQRAVESRRTVPESA